MASTEYQLKYANKRYEKLKAKRLCCQCQKNLNKSDGVKCTDCAKTSAIATKKKRNSLIAKNLCLYCGKIKARKNQKWCDACKIIKQRQNKNYYKTRRYVRCAGCSKLLKNKISIYCQECKLKQQTDKHERKIRYEKQGCCTSCGKIKLKLIKLCFKCWIRALASSNGKCAKAKDLHNLWEDQAGKCAYTGLTLNPGETASLDHKIPRSKGGTDSKNNLQWVHIDINFMKRDLSHGRFTKLCKHVTNHNG